MSTTNDDDEITDTTTFYLEEIVDSDENDDSAISVQDNPIANERTNQRNRNQNLEEKIPFSLTRTTPSPPLITTKVLNSCPQPVGGGATLTVVGRYAYVFGGCNISGLPLGSLHRYNIDSNEWDCNITTASSEGSSSSAPQPRFGHSAVAYHENIYIFGGQGIFDCAATDITTMTSASSMDCPSFVSFHDLYCLDTQTMEWTVLSVNTTATAMAMASVGTMNEEEKQKHRLSPRRSSCWPEARNSHTCALLLHDSNNNKSKGGNEKDRMILYGGANETNGTFDDVWLFYFQTSDWKQIKCQGSGDNIDEMPCGREMHSACLVVEEGGDGRGRGRGRLFMYLMGGRNIDGKVCDDFWKLDLDDYKWTQLSKPPSPRCAHTTTTISSTINSSSPIQHGLYTFGGWDGGQHIFDNCTVYDLDTQQWLPQPVSIESSFDNNVPNIPPRFAHALCTLDNGNVNDDIVGRRRGDEFDDEFRVLIFGGVNKTSYLGDLVLVCDYRRVNDE